MGRRIRPIRRCFAMFVRSPSRPFPFSSVPVPFSPAPALPPIYIRSPIGVAKRRSHPQTTTLRTPQRRQTGTASPFVYAYGTSAQPNGEDIAKRLRSEPVNVTKRRSHPQTTTLRPIRSSPLFPSSPSLFPALGVAKRRWHHRMPTLRTPQRSQTGTAPPNGYTQNPSAQPYGDGITKRLR